MRRRGWVASLLAFLLWMSTASAQEAVAPGLNIVGLRDGQVLRDVVQLSVTVDANVRSLHVYSTVLPWRDSTSHVWGVWRVQGNGATLRIRLDTRLLPEGLQAVTFFTRDTSGRLRAVRALSVAVNNYNTDAPASHMDLESPEHLGATKSGGVTFKVRTAGTGKVASYEFRVARLGERILADDVVLNEPWWNTIGFPAGFYALTVWALDEGGRRIDKATVTVEVVR